MNTIQEIAYKVRQHYFEGFIDEYYKQKKEITHLCNGDKNVLNQFKIETDCILNPDYKKDVKLIDINNRPSGQIGKFYRDDIGIFHNHVPVNNVLYYPVLTHEDEFVEEDIPLFEPFRGIIRNTNIEINPFPWFHSQITFYPNANAIYGILDMWFYKWFFRNTTPDPFKDVIHRMDGPHLEKDGGESYFIDFGSSPPEAFLELVYQTCRDGVDKIKIS